MKLSLSTLSRQIKQKKTAALITVERSKKDSSKSLNLNNDGLAKAQELKKVLKQIEEQIFSTWSDEDIQDFDNKLQVIVNNLSAEEV